MAKKLGRGLDALLGDDIKDFSQFAADSNESPLTAQAASASSAAEGDENGGRIFSVSVELIDPNPYQPRKEFAEADLAELADSIRQIGIIQPLTLRKNGNRYQLISGERRLRAAKLVGLTEVPVYLREADSQSMRVMALVENIQRSDLNAIEVAEGYQELINVTGCSHDELAAFVGKSRTAVTNSLRLLRLPQMIQQAIVEQRVTMGHARALLGLEQESDQLDLLRLIEGKGLSVREVEALVKSCQERETKGGEEGVQPSKDKTKGEFVAIEEEILNALQSRLGWGVTVNSTGRARGKIVIEFRSEGEKQELLRKLLSIEE